MSNVYIADSLTYRIAAAIICITCIVYANMMHKKRRIRFRLFIMLLVITLIDSITMIVSFYAIESKISDMAKHYISYFCEWTYYFTHFAFLPAYVAYIVIISGIAYKFNRVVRIVVMLPFFMLELVLLSNPINNLTFRPIGRFFYARGIVVYFAYGISAIYLVYGLFILFRYWHTMNRMKKFAMIYFMALASIGTIIQMIFLQIKCELLCEAIGLSGVLLMTEKEDDRTDSATGAFNRSALVQDVGGYLSLKRSFTAVCIRIENFAMYRKVIGYINSNSFMGQVAAFLEGAGRKDVVNVYYVGDGVFYVLFEHNDEKRIGKVVRAIEERFENKWVLEEENIKFDVTVLVAECPKQFDSVNDIFLMETAEMNSEKKVFKGAELDFLLRRIDVEKAIGRGIENGSFAVCFRPIYRKEDNKIKLAEVVLKLNDEQIGEIMPDELIVVAESSGFIQELQYNLIERIFKFLSSTADTSDMQLDLCLIPVMSPMMVKKELANKVVRFLDYYRIDPSLLGFVFKESYAFYGKEYLEYIIDIFSRRGIKIFISDYEHGFWGSTKLEPYHFDGAVFDVRSIFDSGDKGEILLNNRIDMVRQLEKTVILSGVDTREYYDKIKDVSADYIEGDLLAPIVTRIDLQNRFWHGERIVVGEDKVERVLEDEL